MCKYITPIKTDTKFVILMHPKEFKKVKNNTGFFTHLSLSNSEVFIGIDFSEHRRINEIIATHESYILFPSEDALNLSDTKSVEILREKPMAIFLIDSTWSCTKKIFTLSSNLNTLKHMSFQTSRLSEYAIKEQPKSHYLSTIESTLVVLELLAKRGIENVTQKEFDLFLTPFYKMIEYQQSLISDTSSNYIRDIQKRERG